MLNRFLRLKRRFSWGPKASSGMSQQQQGSGWSRLNQRSVVRLRSKPYMLLYVLLLQLQALRSAPALALSSTPAASRSSCTSSDCESAVTRRPRHLQIHHTLPRTHQVSAAADLAPLSPISTSTSDAPGGMHEAAGEHSKPPEWWPEGATEPTPLPDLDAMVRASGVTTDSPFLLVGVLTSPASAERRAAVRATWQRFVTHTRTALVLVRYVMGRNAAEVRT